MKREIRKRCGFGCVICGLPFYEYDHIEEWAMVKRHVADEITLLCRQHHGEKTAGLIPKEMVVSANAAPHNRKTGSSKPFPLHFSGDFGVVEMGGNRFTHSFGSNSPAMIVALIDGHPILAFRREEDSLLLALNVYNKFNKLILMVHDNELVYTADSYDIEFIGSTLRVRERHAQILLEIIFQPPARITIPRGRLLYNGVEILIGENSVKVSDGPEISGLQTFQSSIFIIGYPEGSGVFGFADVPRYPPDRGISLDKIR
jgi:hypothetical protein